MYEIEVLVTRLVQELASMGLVNIRNIVESLSAHGEYVFVCSNKRLDYDSMARELSRHPIMLECNRKRAYNAVKILSSKLGKTIYRVLVSRRIDNVYLIFTEDQEEQVSKLFPCTVNKRCKHGNK